MRRCQIREKYLSTFLDTVTLIHILLTSWICHNDLMSLFFYVGYCKYVFFFKVIMDSSAFVTEVFITKVSINKMAAPIGTTLCQLSGIICRGMTRKHRYACKFNFTYLLHCREVSFFQFLFRKIVNKVPRTVKSLVLDTQRSNLYFA